MTPTEPDAESQGSADDAESVGDGGTAEDTGTADDAERADDAETGTQTWPADDAGSVETLTNPTTEAAIDLASAAIERGDLLTVVGRCTVDYEGRAASDLGPGERHLLCKPDGTAMVHTDEGRQPVNWQPPGCEHVVEAHDGRVRFRSTRTTPTEELVVDFERVLQVAAFDLTDEAALSLTGTEEDLRERILADPDLVEPGFTPLATERETPAGAVDVYGEDAEGRTVVLELKRRRAGPDAVGQLRRYTEALDRDLHADADVRGVLVAPSATERARRMLAERDLEFVALEPDGDA